MNLISLESPEPCFRCGASSSDNFQRPFSSSFFLELCLELCRAERVNRFKGIRSGLPALSLQNGYFSNFYARMVKLIFTGHGSRSSTSYCRLSSLWVGEGNSLSIVRAQQILYSSYDKLTRKKRRSESKENLNRILLESIPMTEFSNYRHFLNIRFRLCLSIPLLLFSSPLPSLSYLPLLSFLL